MTLSWYVATILLKCEVAGEPSIPGEWTCIEQVHVIRAPDREIAYEKAIEIGHTEEHSYLNSYQQPVSWKFVGLENLDELLSRVIRDGTEIWGRVIHTQDPENLVRVKERQTVFHIDEIKHLTAQEIIESPGESKLVLNRIVEY